jgi:hypothetical protein
MSSNEGLCQEAGLLVAAHLADPAAAQRGEAEKDTPKTDIRKTRISSGMQELIYRWRAYHPSMKPFSPLEVVLPRRAFFPLAPPCSAAAVG